MKRRAALAVLAGTVAGAALPAGTRAAAEGPDGVIAWGQTGCWVGVGGGELQGLPDRLAPGIDPAPTAQGLWLVTEKGALRCWAPAGDRPWRVRCTVEFGAPVHALAASRDGHWALVAHGEQLSLLDPRGEVAKVFDGTDLARERRGAATALFAMPQRRSFIAAWPALGELWEISLDPGAAPIFDGLVHDYRMSEGIAKPGYLGARRSPLGRPMPALSFADDHVSWLAGLQGDEVIVVHLDVRRRIAALRVDGANPAGAVLRQTPGGRSPSEWWLPAGNEVHVFDTARWVRIAVHALPGLVRQLQVTDSAVWALVGERGAASLFMLRDAHGAAWQRMGGVSGPLLALRAQSRGAQLLALRAEPPALLQIDAGGAMLRAWPLPAGSGFDGVAWLPGG